MNKPDTKDTLCPRTGKPCDIAETGKCRSCGYTPNELWRIRGEKFALQLGESYHDYE